MNDYTNIEELKEEFWEKIRPRSKEELENDAMLIKVKEHFDKLIDDLLNQDALVCGPNQQSKIIKFKEIKKEMDDYILGLTNANY